MARLPQFFLAIFVVLVLFNLCSLLAVAQQSGTGTAAFHDSDKLVPSACNGNEDKGPLVGGVSNELFQNGLTCGHKYKLTHGEKSVEVEIVDHCIDQGKDKCQTFVLTKETFAQLADPTVGTISVSFQRTL